VFWEGTHWQRMRALMDSVAATPAQSEAPNGRDASDARDASAPGVVP
jgi:hypothetical protein